MVEGLDFTLSSRKTWGSEGLIAQFGEIMFREREGC